MCMQGLMKLALFFLAFLFSFIFLWAMVLFFLSLIVLFPVFYLDFRRLVVFARIYTLSIDIMLTEFPKTAHNPTQSSHSDAAFLCFLGVDECLSLFL